MSHVALASIFDERQFCQPLSPHTLRNYRVGVRRWAACGVSALDDVNPASAQRFLEARLARNSIASVKTDFCALLAVLSYLERTGRFSAAALVALRRLSPDLPRRRQLCANYLTPEQLERYCAGADERAAFLARLACYTGLRASELAQLRFEDLDIARRLIHVRRGKTGARQVPLCVPAIELLRPRMGTGPVFVGGMPFGVRERAPGVVGQTLAKWLRIGGRGSSVRVNLVTCRHSRASWWIAAGVPVAKVAKWLGHSVEVCLRHYAGLAEAYDPAAELGAAG